MLRDTIKSEIYFLEYFQEEDKRIEKFKFVLNTLTSEQKKQRVQISRFIATIYRNYVSAMYSYGAKIEEISDTFNMYLEYLKLTKVADYAETVDVLSIAILTNADYNSVKSVLKLEFSDPLTIALADYLKGGSFEIQTQELKFPSQYSHLWEFLKFKEDTDISEIISYVSSKWYNSCKDMYWYDTHISDENIYAGYWCWVAAAIIKISGKHLDNDLTYKYLPVDLIN